MWSDAAEAPANSPSADRCELPGFLERATIVSAECHTLRSAAARLLAEACELDGWRAGHMWEVTPGPPSTLVPTPVWHCRDDLPAGGLGELIEVAAGSPAHDLAVRAMATGRPAWTTDGLVRPGRPTGDQAGSPLAGAATFPVVVAGGAGPEVVAVLGLFADDGARPGAGLLDLLAAAGGQLARVVERQQATTRLHRAEERFRALAADRILHDARTGLPTRAVFLDRLEVALARAGRASRAGRTVAVVCTDIDRFRAVNERRGDQAGDLLVSTVARRLEEALPPGMTVARTGADEFAVLGEDLEGDGGVDDLVERVRGVFATPFRPEPPDATGDGAFGGPLRVTASIGVAVSRRPTGNGAGGDAELLLREAGVALDHARGRGRGRVGVFDEAMRSVAPWRRVTEDELGEAIDSGQLRLHYQPVVDLAGGEMVGVEALVRWQHPAQGLLRPADFIPLADATGLVVPLGRWVLHEACRQAAGWQELAGPRRGLTVAVNVSAHQFAEPDWVAEVSAALSTSGLTSTRLVLEITESAVMEDTDASIRRLSELRDLGVRLAVDDFGTGYSSLAYLRNMPVSFLKIDKGFVDGVTGGPHESALARAMLKLASTLGLGAIAEGIEHREQADVLRALGCGLGQGLWLGPPEPAGAIGARLRHS